MTLVRFVCWLNITTLENKDFPKITQRQWNYALLSQQISVVEWHIIS